jgi:hypothetical protein
MCRVIDLNIVTYVVKNNQIKVINFILALVNTPVQNCGKWTLWKHILRTILMYHLIFTHLKGPVISRSFRLNSINVPATSGTRFDHDPWTG